MATPKRILIEADIWAHGPNGQQNITKPVKGKIADGYASGEKPHHEHFNWIYNIIMNDLVHIMQNGLPLWDNMTEYQDKALTLYQGNIYRSKKPNNKGNQPTGKTDANWYKNLVDFATLVQLKAAAESVAIDPKVLKDAGVEFKANLNDPKKTDLVIMP